MLLRLLSADMADDELYARRLGFWLRMARERAGKSQGGVAEFLGFSKKSKSSISDYENGVTVPALPVLRRLAEWYGVPLGVFTDPQPTPEERLDEIVRLAEEQERGEWESAAAREPAPGQAPRAVHGQHEVGLDGFESCGVVRWSHPHPPFSRRGRGLPVERPTVAVEHPFDKRACPQNQYWTVDQP